MKKTAAALLFTTLLTSLAVSQAEAGLRRRCRRLCRPEITRCAAAGFTWYSCTQVLRADCMARGGSYCLFVPPTTTTTTVTTIPVPTTTTTTLPSNPFAVYDGTWGYAVSYVTYSGCYTNYPTNLSGTLVLSVSPTGAITGTVDSVSISGSFTSASSASVSSPAYPDVHGSYTTFDANTSGWTPSSGTIDVYLYQSCSPGVVCEDLYSGAIAR